MRGDHNYYVKYMKKKGPTRLLRDWLYLNNPSATKEECIAFLMDACPFLTPEQVETSYHFTMEKMRNEDRKHQRV